MSHTDKQLRDSTQVAYMHVLEKSRQDLIKKTGKNIPFCRRRACERQALPPPWFCPFRFRGKYELLHLPYLSPLKNCTIIGCAFQLFIIYNIENKISHCFFIDFNCIIVYNKYELYHCIQFCFQ